MQAVDFDDPFAVPEAEGPLRVASDATHALLFTLVDGARDCRAIGRRALVIAWLAGALPEIRTQSALAKRLGVTDARASQILAELRRSHRGNESVA